MPNTFAIDVRLSGEWPKRVLAINIERAPSHFLIREQGLQFSSRSKRFDRYLPVPVNPDIGPQTRASLRRLPDLCLLKT